MREKKKSSAGKSMKQSKITAFYTKRPAELELPEKCGQKRKNEEEVDGENRTPKKIALSDTIDSPDIFLITPEGCSKKIMKSRRELFFGKEELGEKNDENRSEYFIENTPPFTQGNSSPRKRLSPRKTNLSPLQVIDNIDCNQQVRDHFDDIAFEDFENDIFLSPEKSPRKKVEENWFLEKSEVNFETPVRCKVLKSFFVSKGRCEQILQVEDEKTKKKGICKLRDVWTYSNFTVQDTLSVQTLESAEGWVIDNKTGYVILHPDVIISSTFLVSSMFCMRQGLFSNFYKSLDSGNNNKMLIGRLVHELLQECLKTRSCSEEDTKRIISGFLSSRDYFRDFYFSDMSRPEIETELKSFVPSVRNFLDVYIENKVPPSGKNFTGNIENVLDIEELVRSNNLGFQGRIDVTVKMKSKKSGMIAPLELKTGRASFSNEHRSQLILYVLLMKETGRKVESGLLLYLRDNIMEEIVPQRDEIRNLFLLRNQLVGYYKNLSENNLPEPIWNIRACAKCSYLRVCTSLLKTDDEFDNHPLKEIEIPDIKKSHLEYFIKWNKILWLEYGQIFDEVIDDCEIGGLKLLSISEGFNNELRHDFSRTCSTGGKNLHFGTFVHIMNGKSNRICTGKIIEVTDISCSVSLEKRLEDFSEIYKIVVFKSKFLNHYLSNLGWFLDERFQSLRDIIIDKRVPSFRENFDKKTFIEKCLRRLVNLNKEQQKAVLKSLLCNDYLLIKGPPGTGKTQTIVTLVRILVALDLDVLISSHTHSSVDNILLRLDDVEYLRLGSLKSIHEKVHPKSYATLIENCNSVDDVRKLFERKVIASTCLGLDPDFINRKKVDVCIIDESSQVLQPEILKPLFCCKKFILVGDEDQLPPIVQNTEAKELGMDISIFEWLKSDVATVSLKYQYRMNFTINSLANAIAYNGTIECANEDVAKGTLEIVNREEYKQSDKWILDILCEELEKSVIFVDTSAYFESEVKTPTEQRSSILETNIIVKLLKSLIKFGLDEDKVGIIAPFCDQIELMKKKLIRENLRKVELNTVDQYQGRDKEVILFSCGKENQADKAAIKTELLNDKRRLTVAVTRAKHKLVIVGDRRTVARYEPFKRLINALNESQFIRLVDGWKNFFWKNFLD